MSSPLSPSLSSFFLFVSIFLFLVPLFFLSHHSTPILFHHHLSIMLLSSPHPLSFVWGGGGKEGGREREREENSFLTRNADKKLTPSHELPPPHSLFFLSPLPLPDSFPQLFYPRTTPLTLLHLWRSQVKLFFILFCFVFILICFCFLFCLFSFVLIFALFLL